MSESISDLDLLRRDWQEAGPPPALSLTDLRRRLWRRWLLVGLEALVLIGIGAMLAWFALRTSDAMGWIYLGFFVAAYAVTSAVSIRLRLKALWREDDSAQAILDHAWRDANMREKGGVVGVWLCGAVFVFVLVWMLVAGVQDELPLGSFLAQQWGALVFGTVWCLAGTLASARMHAKGRLQKAELTRLRWSLDLIS